MNLNEVEPVVTISELNLMRGYMSNEYSGRLSLAYPEGTLHLRLSKDYIDAILLIVEPLRKQSERLLLSK